jgi:hypothetical protein
MREQRTFDQKRGDMDMSPSDAEAELPPHDPLERFRHNTCSVDADGYLWCSSDCLTPWEHGKKVGLSVAERAGFVAAGAILARSTTYTGPVHEKLRPIDG